MKPAAPSGVTAWLIYLVPFVLALGFIFRYGVNVPFVDQWMLPALFNAVAHHQGVLRDLLTCNNEHPVFFPKLIWIALAFATKWNVRVDLAATLLTMALIFIACASLALREDGGSVRWPLTVSLLVTSLLLFSFVHSDTFLGGYQLAFVLANASAVTAIWLLSALRRTPFRALILAWLCCVAASFSSLHGMVAWIAILPCLPLLFQCARDRAIALCATGVLAAASIAVYEWVFIQGPYPSDHSYWRHHPLVTGKFFLALLGLPLVERDMATALRLAGSAGVLVLLLFLAAAWWTLRSAQWRAALPWISIGLYGLGFAAMTALGRSSWGEIGAVASTRYTSCAVLVAVAAIQLWRQALADRHSSRLAFLGLAALVTAASADASISSIPVASRMARDRTRGADCLEVLEYIDPRTEPHWEGCLFPLMPIEQFVYMVREPAEILDSLGWLKLAKHVSFIDKPASSYGSFDAGASGAQPALVAPKDWIYCSGWTAIPNEGRAPKAVLFSVGGARLFIAETRAGAAAGGGSGAGHRFGWSAWVPAKFLAPGTSELFAWAFDDRRQEFVRLEGSKAVTVR